KSRSRAEALVTSFVDVLLFSFQGSCCRRFVCVVRCCLATFIILKHVYIPVNTFEKLFIEVLFSFSSFSNSLLQNLITARFPGTSINDFKV
ncbi:hypothetical protein, partial [Planococcus ruber]|uniref:hypothetical protein n=1 Tax=Planococcus ruber TaxID=2027871 RepID=UPI001FEE6134